MKLKFNKFERVAGVFVLLAILGSLFTAVSVAVKQGWFEPKFKYHTVLSNADGVHAGTAVQMAGLRAGAVDDVELQSDNSIRVTFYVQGKFKDKIKMDSRALLTRPFIIGERVLEVTVGSENEKRLAENMTIESEETTDIMTVLSGKKLGVYLNQMGEVMANLQNLAQAFLNKERTESMVSMFDKLDPLLGNLNTMSVEVVKLSKQASTDENLRKTLQNVVIMSREINRILPALNEQNPELATHLAQLTRNLAVTSEQLKVMSNAMKDLGPEMPATARRAVEALNEATVLMKALQKSFFLKSAAEEVRKEEKQNRKPASKTEP